MQPRLNDTIVTALDLGQSHGRAVKSVTSLSGLAVPFDLDGSLCLSLARENGGEGVLIEDEDALDAQASLLTQEGLMVEPAGAASVAGVIKAASGGRIGGNDVIVCVLTGHGFKDGASIGKVAERFPVRDVQRQDLPAVLKAH